MKIAVTYDNGNVFQHFGQTREFKIYDVKDKQIISKEIVSSGEYSHGALAGFLRQLSVDVLICGGLGLGAKNRIEAEGITLYGGVQGNCDQAVQDYLNGTLVYDPLAAEHHGPCHH